MKIKKKFINPILLTLLSFDNSTQLPISGLLLEEMGLGCKRKAQKIRKELLTFAVELEDDGKEIIEKHKDDIGEQEKELNILIDEEITLISDPMMLSEIEKIKTDKNYDFDLIEMIAV